ncbi:lytic transglycosylase domain-containing protein (plasmid) [Atlantibacter subterranea]|uniref:lytic transglycosylase domain-containing protein n=1 Tax=Atlantibacter subterraneus TaxID=255519 RepID=UPI0020C456CE|nr:lytic transglycosylase domain-containing protein [Atlantibacter subterranea]UTJ49789.1 lytic transglycosylase domain-containing protein [Atlantibacter subterranea]
MSIKIPVSAEFDGSELNKQIGQINARLKQMGDAVAKANGQKFEPITLKTKEDLRYFVQQSEKLLKIQGELRNRMQKSGQGNANPFMANWSNMYLNEATRLRRQQEALVFLGASFEDASAPRRPNAPPPPPPINRNPPGGSAGAGGTNPWTQQGTRILQSGLNAAGPVGGVASQAFGTGMVSGFGAGLMGLVGGMAALGVGKLVGAIADKISDAQTEAIASDQLMRRLGGGLGYLSTRNGVRAAAERLGLNYNDAMPLAESMVRLGNLGGDRARDLPEELANAGGLARGFGLDPAAGVGLFGQLRGLNLTRSADDSRRVGMIIGETIAKSDAFAKADEVMEAIAAYATVQTRQSLGVLNLAGYSGQLSAMAGSGIPGLDVAGSASLLSRVNAALSQGGAKGEASQFFTAMVGNRMGLDPVQTQVLREGGAFATNDSMFGPGSMAARFGIRGPGGNRTFLQETLDVIRDKYHSPGFQAMATASHLGISMNQAMALLRIKPNEMGDIQQRMGRIGFDMKNLSADGIADIARINSPGADLNKIGDSFMSRTGKGALSGEEADRLRNAMASGDSEALKDILTELAAQKGQAETEGSKTRDTITGVANRLQDFASKSLPLLNDSRAALLYLAGKQGGGSPADLRMKAIESDHDDRVAAIKGKYDNLLREEGQRLVDARMAGDPTNPASLERSRKLQEESNARYDELVKKRDAELEAETQRWKKSQETERQETINRYSTERPVGASPINHGIVAQNESGNRDYDRAGNIITSSAGAMGRMQTMPGTLRDPGFGVAPARNNTPDEMARVGHDYLDAMYARYGNVDKALAAYNWGPGRVDAAVTRYGDDWFRHAPAETQQYIRKYHRANAAIPARTPAQLPQADTRSSDVNFNVSAQPIEVVVKNDRGEQIAPTQSIQTQVKPAQSWGHR